MARASRRQPNDKRGHWGARPVPLLPARIRGALSGKDLPASLRKATGRAVSADALDREFWNDAPDLNPACLKDLVGLATAMIRQHSDWPIVDAPKARMKLDSLALEDRTRKVFAAEFGNRPIDVGALTWRDLLELRNVGPKRALELACAIELAVLGDVHAEPASKAADQPTAEPEQIESPVEAPTDTPSRTDTVHEAAEERRPDPVQATVLAALPPDFTTFFRVLAAWAYGEHGHATLAAALGDPSPRWPPELNALWSRLRDSDTESIAGSLKHRYSVQHLVARLFDGCDQRHRFVLQARLFTTARPTAHEALAKVFGLSVPDTRALEDEATQRLQRIDSSSYAPLRRRAEVIRQRLGSAVPDRDPDLAATLSMAVNDRDHSTSMQFEKDFLLWLAGPYRWERGWLVAYSDIVRRSIRELLHRRNDAGLIADLLVHETLSNLKIRSVHHDAWIERLGKFIRRPNGLLLSANDKAA